MNYTLSQKAKLSFDQVFYLIFIALILLLSSLQDDPRAREALMASAASAVATSAASTNMTSNEQQSTATLAKSSSILQELCSRPKNYGANPTTGGASMEIAATASSEAEKQPLQSPAVAPVATVLPQPESPGLKMKIKRSNSTNSKDSAEDKNETESRPKKSSNSKRKKDMAAATSSSSTSSSRSSSPRYYELKQTLYKPTIFNLFFVFFIRSSASPISQLPPFLLAAMTAGANGPRLDALLRQMSQGGGPPSKKPKVGNNILLKTLNFPTAIQRERDYSSSFSKVQMCAKSNPLKDKSAQWMSSEKP